MVPCRLDRLRAREHVQQQCLRVSARRDIDLFRRYGLAYLYFASADGSLSYFHFFFRGRNFNRALARRLWLGTELCLGYIFNAYSGLFGCRSGIGFIGVRISHPDVRI
jgi:hypothetical protein